jgi:aminobenzoyl-glutamate transport protein
MAETQKGILGWIERTGNRLPDPVFIFFWLIGFLIVISVIASAFGYSAPHPTELDEAGAPVIITAESLLSPDNIRRLWVEMPETFTHFHPLGYVLLVMLGAGVAERSGLFASAMREAVRNAPKYLLTPVVVFVSMLSHLAADAGYVVLIPLAAVLYAAANRHPIAGIAAAFAGVSGGFGANFIPGQLDALLFGITEAAAETVVPGWDANIAGNWYFIAAMAILFVPLIWWLTDAVIEPRLKRFSPPDDAAMQNIGAIEATLTPEQRKGLGRAGVVALLVFALWAAFVFMPGTPLVDEEAATPQGRLTPFYQSLVAGFFVLFFACGWAYGAAAGTVKNHREVVKLMSAAMGDMSYYLVLAFAASHFVAMFDWSNLGLIFAVQGSDGAGAGADDDADGGQPGNDDGGLPRRRQHDQHHHAVDDVFRSGADVLSALARRVRAGQSHRDDDPLLAVADRDRHRADLRLGLSRPTARTRRGGGLHAAGNACSAGCAHAVTLPRERRFLTVTTGTSVRAFGLAAGDDACSMEGPYRMNRSSPGARSRRSWIVVR